jgi:ABC-2 type transport system ATP-binding protein
MSNIIEIQGLSKIFGGKTILNGINLEIPQNGLFGIVGLNGAGKTTTIKCLLNLIPEYEGTILIDSKPTKEAKNRSIIAYMPERFSPNANITGYEYIKTYSRIYNTPFKKEKVDDIAQDISLDLPFLNLRTKECSKGTIQKIGILACIYVNVKVVILDEPTSGLDIIARRNLKKALVKHSKEKTIIFSSHILSDVEELAQNIAVIAHGDLIFSGTPHDFIKQNNAQNIEEAFVFSSCSSKI